MTIELTCTEGRANLAKLPYMTLSVPMDSLQIKALFKEAMLELMLERREEFAELMAEALEDLGLIHAIEAGRASDFVSRTEITGILDAAHNLP